MRAAFRVRDRRDIGVHRPYRLAAIDQDRAQIAKALALGGAGVGQFADDGDRSLLLLRAAEGRRAG